MALEQQGVRLEDVELAAQFGNERHRAGVHLAIGQVTGERNSQALRCQVGLQGQSAASKRQAFATRHPPEIEYLLRGLLVRQALDRRAANVKQSVSRDDPKRVR